MLEPQLVREGSRYGTDQHSPEMLWSPQGNPGPDSCPRILPYFWASCPWTTLLIVLVCFLICKVKSGQAPGSPPALKGRRPTLRPPVPGACLQKGDSNDDRGGVGTLGSQIQHKGLLLQVHEEQMLPKAQGHGTAEA